MTNLPMPIASGTPNVIPLPNMTSVGEQKVTTKEYLRIFLDSKWWIIGTLIGAVGCAVIYNNVATPIYKTAASVQVEGNKGNLTDKDDSSKASGEKQTEAEKAIITSRAVLGPAVDQLKPAIQVEPQYFPILGKLMAKMNIDLPFGANSYVRGNESVTIAQLNVPQALEDKRLALMADSAGDYHLLDQRGNVIAKGKVGETIRYPIEMKVVSLNAHPGAKFIITRQSRESMISNLQKSLMVMDVGKQSGILSLSLTGQDPVQLKNQMQTILQSYVSRNVMHQTEETKTKLKFITEQLPVLRSNLNLAETELAQFRARNSAINTNTQSDTVIHQIADIDKEILNVQLQQAELGQKFTESHPAMIALAKKMADLQSRRATLSGQMGMFPQKEKDLVRLERNVKVANDLYMLMLGKAQELQINATGTLGSVRILDNPTVPSNPIKPQKNLALVLSAALGLMLGTAIAFIRKGMSGSLDNTDKIENRYSVRVFASIPHSEKQLAMEKQYRKKVITQPQILSVTDGADFTVENLRSIRTSLETELQGAHNNIVMIGGAGPNTGKSFISVNLAAIEAAAGKRVLLIDCDLRRGSLGKYFSPEPTNGLSDALANGAELIGVIQRTKLKNLDFISAGTVKGNSSDLLISSSFAAGLAKLSEMYDVVLIDTPPMLVLTDGMLISRLAGSNFLVVRPGISTDREIESVIKHFRQNGVTLSGLILNDYKLKAGSYGREAYRYYLQYEQKYSA